MIQVLQEGNITKSKVQMVPESEDDGAILACRAENPSLEASALEDSRVLSVLCKFRFHSPDTIIDYYHLGDKIYL